MFHDAHAEGADLEVRDDGVKLAEARETEEDVDDVCRQIGISFPILPQYSGQGTNHSFWRNNDIKYYLALEFQSTSNKDTPSAKTKNYVRIREVSFWWEGASHAFTVLAVKNWCSLQRGGFLKSVL